MLFLKALFQNTLGNKLRWWKSWSPPLLATVEWPGQAGHGFMSQEQSSGLGSISKSKGERFWGLFWLTR